MKNKTKSVLIFIGILTFFCLLIGGVLFNSYNAKASSPAGMATLIASSTVKAIVGPSNAVTLFNFNVDCASRVITTYANPIMFTFATSSDLSSTVKPTGTFGHYQAASTTIAYDSGIYGCGLWQAYGFGASTTISISEFKGFR